MADDAKVEALVRGLFEDVFNRGDAAAAQRLLAPEFVAHDPSVGELHGPQAILGMIAGFRESFPDLSYRIVQVLVSGEDAAVRWVATGTQQRAFMGIAPTHRQVQVVGHDFFHVAGERLAEAWVCSDFFGLFKQLGQFPPPRQ